MKQSALTRLKTGNFTHISQEWQTDGTVIITLSKRSESKTYQFCVKDLYGANEEVLWEKTTERS